MLKIAIIGDIHLSYLPETVQYDAFEFAIEKIKGTQPDVVVCLGDVTANGDLGAANYFICRMKEIQAPKLFVLGNSDLRTKDTAEAVKILQTDNELRIDGLRLIGIDTSKGQISPSDKNLLHSSDTNTIVFMHHPYWTGLEAEDAEVIHNFQKNGHYRALVHGHMHYYEKKENVYSMQALDPDKATGGPPCVTYLIIDAEETHTEFDCFPTDMPMSAEEYIGLSCFHPKTDIPAASENGIRNIELRPDAVYEDREKLKKLIRIWRENGGKYLSLHMPDFGYDGKLTGCEEWEAAVKCASDVLVDGVTIHVPKTSLKNMRNGAESILLRFLSGHIKNLPPDCVIGIENMHMTAQERDNEDRRFGYIPQECVDFMNKINDTLGFEKAGLLFDVGHARNNAPYSEKYPIGAWYGEVGKYAVAYHIHQITNHDNEMKNHTPITSLCGGLISYCGFSYCWNHNKINHRPMFLEIRGGYDEYIKSVRLFKEPLKNSNRDF